MADSAARSTDARRWARDGTTLLLAEADLDEATLAAPSGDTVTVAGPLAEITAYLTGRPSKLTTTGGDPAPALEPWL